MTNVIPIDDLLRFVREDAPWGDLTSETVVPDVVCRAVIRAMSPNSPVCVTLNLHLPGFEAFPVR